MLRQKQVKSILNKHKKRDSWFLNDYSVNLQRRLSLVMVKWYTRKDEHHTAIKKLISNLENDNTM